MPRFRDVPQFTRNASYRVDVPWDYLKDHMTRSAGYAIGGLDIDPDFQRAHVWSERQQVRYVEWILRGGMTGKDLFWNCTGWNGRKSKIGPYVLVDGKQRLTAVLRFLDGEITAFGHRISEYTDKPPMLRATFSWWVNDLETRAEVLQWYLDLNGGGVLHTEEELAKVEALLVVEKQKE